MEPIVFKNVSKLYDKKAVLDNLTLFFPLNKTTAIIGPSGSGKSTLLQLINGLLRPSQGHIYVFNHEIDYKNLPELRTRIGYAVQGTGLFPHLTVEVNISLLARLQNWEKSLIDARVKELMKLVDLKSDFGSKYPHELSGGEQQRVGLCRAMMLNPKIFLLDEPFAALDPITRSEIHYEFKKLQKSAARTIILVTHDLREAIKLADYILILNHGRIEQTGTREDILNKPANNFIKKFIHLQLEDDVQHIYKKTC